MRSERWMMLKNAKEMRCGMNVYQVKMEGAT